MPRIQQKIFLSLRRKGVRLAHTQQQRENRRAEAGILNHVHLLSNARNSCCSCSVAALRLGCGNSRGRTHCLDTHIVKVGSLVTTWKISAISSGGVSFYWVVACPFNNTCTLRPYLGSSFLFQKKNTIHTPAQDPVWMSGDDVQVAGLFLNSKSEAIASSCQHDCFMPSMVVPKDVHAYCSRIH